MRRLPFLALAAGLSLLALTWLLLRGVDDDSRNFREAFSVLDQVELAESSLLRDVLRARAGLLRNYDSLVGTAQLLDEAVEQLRHSGLVAAASVERLAGWRENQAALLEAFKSDNALVQNSLAQFGQIARHLALPEDGATAVPGAGPLASAMLDFALRTSPDAAQEVHRGLELLAATPLRPDAGVAVSALLAHGHLLIDLMPTADRTLRALLAGASETERQAIRQELLLRQAAARRVSLAYRLSLYAASVLLLAGLTALGLHLRARSRAQARRAAFEHMLADISTGFIATGPAEVRAQVERALGRIAAQLGARRAYLLLAGPHGQEHGQEYVWQETGTGRSAGWPARAWSLAAHLGQAGESILRLSRGDRLPASLRAELSGIGLHGWVAAVRTSPEGGLAALLGCDIARPDLPLPAISELAPLRLALDAVANVAERALLESERRRLEAHLQQSRRMELLGSFASGIAHNFNNILAAIVGYAEMAEDAPAPAEARRADSLLEIRRASEKARDLVTQILDFGRGREMTRRPVAAQGLVDDAARLLCASLPEGVRLRIGSIPASALLYGDAAQLQQVILNLCGNAAQAMGGAGGILLGVEQREIAHRRRLEQGQLAPGRYVVLAITDTGPGIDRALRRRIFEPFFTTRAAGHGLGLATVREIVLGHGGAIGLRSTPGQGSRFDIWLPCAGMIGPAADGAAPPEVGFGAGETVLLLNPLADRLAVEEELLAALGYEPVGFSRAEELLQAIRTTPDRFDLALLCGPGPGASALKLADGLRRAKPGLAVILAAPAAGRIDAEAAAARGVAEILRWPLDSRELARALGIGLQANRGG
jgi:signal transduction histidine kinase